MYADSHIEFIHHPTDLADLPNAAFLKTQINPTLINQIQPELLFTAVYVDPGPNAWERTEWVIATYQECIRDNGWILVQSKADLNKLGIKIILHIEDLHMIGDDLTKIKSLYDRGIRSIGLTHNHANQFAGGSLSPEVGLTDFGREAIKQLTELGMILDFAHLSTQSFRDVATSFELAPFVSHTGLHGVYPTPRNFDDSLLSIVRDRNGYIGVGVAGSFLGEKSARIQDVAQHILYAIEKTSPLNVGIGSDLGGTISFVPDGLTNISEVTNLLEYGINADVLGKNLIHFLARSPLRSE
ncbi:MAG TPA: membrane dipeptidase [Patescibacteria group bacterium]